MAGKRSRKKKANKTNKKARPCTILQDYILNTFPCDEFDYYFFDFALKPDSPQGLCSNEQDSVLLFKMNFEVFNFDFSNDTQADITTSGLCFNSNNELLLLLICGDTQSHFNLNYHNFSNDELVYDFNRWLFLVKSFKSKIFLVDGFLKTTNSTYLQLNIYIARNVIIDNCEDLYSKLLKKNDNVLSLMHFFYDYPYYTNMTRINEKTSLDEFYSIAYNSQKEHDIYETISLSKNDSLIPTLRHYQESAVKWMLYKENHNSLRDHQILFEKIHFWDIELYYHKALGHFITEKVYQEYIANFPSSLGGILADEMGLGKTIETLALILHNKKPNVQLEDFYLKFPLFSFADNPLFGNLQCNCGNMDNISVIENMSVDALVKYCKTQKYFLNQNLIKCLLCANYQHLECSQYQIDEESDHFPYLCSRCWLKVDPIDSGCTLIVCPTSICHQWIDEIGKHLTNVKVLKYDGVRSKEYISPPDLAKNDIVITTYDVLNSEILFSAQYDYDQLRNAKRYYPPLSPLLCVRWWRLCFDEAQLVEGTFTRAAQMANMFTSTYRWAITGTPIQQSVSDLFGLFYFIREEPFCNIDIWNNALYYPYCSGDSEPMINAITNCFWRTPKNVVIKEIGLYEPKYHFKNLELSQIERDFYLRQVFHCKKNLDNVLKNVNMSSKLGDLSTTSQAILLNMALKLRQCCCHPIVASSSQQSVKQYSSLQDVLDKMIEDTKYDCEKAHREQVAAMNGRAGVLLQKLDMKMGIETYKDALKSILKHEEDFRTDKTQQYHIYYNLAEIVELFGCTQVDGNNAHFPAFNGTQLSKSDISPELHMTDIEFSNDDKQFRIKAKQIYDKYIASEKLAAITTDKYRLELIQQSNDLQKNFRFNGKWFVAALNALSSQLSIEEVDNVLNFAQLFNSKPDSSANYTQNMIMIKLDLNLTTLEEARKEMIDNFDNLLEKILSEDKVDHYINCHVKKDKDKDSKEEKKTKKCILCVTELKCVEYERSLFNMQNALDEANKTNPTKATTSRRRQKLDPDATDVNERKGNWNESNTIAILRKLAQLYKTRALYTIDYESLVEESENFLKYIEEIKKEFRTHRKFWTNLSEYILRIDELNQAQTRYIVSIDSKNTENVAQLIEASINEAIAQFAYDQTGGEKRLSASLDRLKYLKNLKNTLKDKDSVHSRVCSICWCDLTAENQAEFQKYFILTCGHLFCTDCIIQIGRLGPDSGTIKCSVCRSVCTKDSLCAIAAPQKVQEDNIEVNGEWSTKLVHIIRCVKKILESNEKILIFSTWVRMLELMRAALEQNDIESCLITSSDRNFSAKIKTFQNSSTKHVLLLPTNFACNGLNLVEASHVIFINPSLNKADEHQAIGRIYRIGQTRQTHIYKFTIKDSIESLIENYHQTIFQRHKREKSEFNNMTVQQFFNFFDT